MPHNSSDMNDVFLNYDLPKSKGGESCQYDICNLYKLQTREAAAEAISLPRTLPINPILTAIKQEN